MAEAITETRRSRGEGRQRRFDGQQPRRGFPNEELIKQLPSPKAGEQWFLASLPFRLRRLLSSYKGILDQYGEDARVFVRSKHEHIGELQDYAVIVGHLLSLANFKTLTFGDDELKRFRDLSLKAKELLQTIIDETAPRIGIPTNGLSSEYREFADKLQKRYGKEAANTASGESAETETAETPVVSGRRKAVAPVAEAA
jgi:hypothetical protein